MRGGLGGSGLLLLAFVAACTSGKFHEEVVIDRARVLREGMSVEELTRVMRPPDFKSTGGHRFAYRFGDAAKTIDPSWVEWIWFEDDEVTIYVAYVSGDVVRKVGIVYNSPPPSRGDGFGMFCLR
ncbi:MAG TPA: hypothetical protein VFY93_18090 [Planctomycetota bacterium]|nr:hypothetical protein [Planctomycetota bacterium]